MTVRVCRFPVVAGAFSRSTRIVPRFAVHAGSAALSSPSAVRWRAERTCGLSKLRSKMRRLCGAVRAGFRIYLPDFSVSNMMRVRRESRAHFGVKHFVPVIVPARLNQGCWSDGS